ncbi:hypothetical protein G6F50_013381 [Rhizopus delemar]|uniref:ABC transporter domain-containing protein n=1 Tax=Rhizopus delemar TaxID=936053 RepID=A0A9P6YJD0_9FUNG|nr:hypothetical protein G6F50_013381 [Rhizopus delemar]
MTALHPGQVGVRLAELAQDLPTPRAIVMASAHWLGRQPLVGAHPQPPTIHAFGGFPRAVFELPYPAPGDPALAEEVADRIAAAGLPVALDPQRGLDHGAWVPLRLLRPQADIPVVPVSIQPLLGPEHQFALGRALVREPAVFLLDEPLSNLDAKLRHSVRTEIAQLHRKLGTTMIYVTHDQVEAMTLGQRIVVLKDGVIQQIDTPMALAMPVA